MQEPSTVTHELNCTSFLLYELGIMYEMFISIKVTYMATVRNFEVNVLHISGG
jgi:hypothetical protein